MEKKARMHKGQNRPLSRADLQSLKPIKATQKNPHRRPGSMRRIFQVTSQPGTLVSPKVNVNKIEAEVKGSSLWEVAVEVEGTSSEHLPGNAGRSVPVPRGGKRRGGAAMTSSYCPKWLDVSFLPKTLPQPVPPKLWVKGRRADPLCVFPDDRRQILFDTSYPWLCIGKIFNSDGFAGSGILIGERLLLTARHVLPWNGIAAGNWWMKFVPHYFDGNEPFGSSFVSDWTAYGTDDDQFNASHDYAVLRLYNPLGNQLGYLGSTSFDDSWRGINIDNVGYPSDIAGGQRPAWQLYSVEDDYEDDDGQILENEASLERGSSGGPFFAWFDGNVRVIGVVSGCASIDGDRDNILAGGDNMVSLIDWASANWPL
jgi:V8-like Glu-specific endopeptidase